MNENKRKENKKKFESLHSLKKIKRKKETQKKIESSPLIYIKLYLYVYELKKIEMSNKISVYYGKTGNPLKQKDTFEFGKISHSEVENLFLALKRGKKLNSKQQKR